MKKFCYWLFLAVMLFATMNSGCGGSGGGDIAIPKTDTQTQTSDAIQVVIDDSDSYTTRYKALYGRETGGEWVLLAESTNGDMSFDIDTKYSELGFEFDITDKTNWLFSNTFYTNTASEVSDAAAPQAVSITLGGTESNPTIEARVDGVTVHSNGALTDTNSRYDWGNAAGDHDTEYYTISVHITNPSLYNLKSKNFYGRQRGGRWVNLTNGTDFTVSSKYVEFGFEFDITWGTDWPYSNVFWTAEQSEHETVRDINIEMGGMVRNASISIRVNGNTVVYDGNCDSHSRYPW